MSDEKYSLDTNILIYAVDLDSGYRHQKAIETMDSVRSKECVLSLQVFTEFFSVVTQKQIMPIEEAKAQILDWQVVFPVTSPNLTI